MGKAKITWKPGESYDEWDNISSTIFDNLVKASLYGEVMTEYPMAEYDLEYEDYSALDLILVYNEEYVDEKLIFISFANGVSIFDDLKVAALDSLNKTKKTYILKYSTSEFAFERTRNGKKEVVKDLTIVL